MDSVADLDPVKLIREFTTAADSGPSLTRQARRRPVVGGNVRVIAIFDRKQFSHGLTRIHTDKFKI